MHHACANGRVEVMGELLKLGMDLNFENNLGETPIYLALKNGRSQVVIELIDNHDLDVNAVDNSDDSEDAGFIFGFDLPWSLMIV